MNVPVYPNWEMDGFAINKDSISPRTLAKVVVIVILQQPVAKSGRANMHSSKRGALIFTK